MKQTQKHLPARILAAAAMTLLPGLIPMQDSLKPALYLAAYLLAGYDVLRRAGKDVSNRCFLSKSVLLSAATGGFFILAACSGGKSCSGAAAVMLLYQIGTLLASWAAGKNGSNTAARSRGTPGAGACSRSSGYIKAPAPQEPIEAAALTGAIRMAGDARCAAELSVLSIPFSCVAPGPSQEEHGPDPSGPDAS